jgi:hypothetical protein
MGSDLMCKGGDVVHLCDRIDVMRTMRFLIYNTHPAARGGVLQSENTTTDQR